MASPTTSMKHGERESNWAVKAAFERAYRRYLAFDRSVRQDSRYSVRLRAERKLDRELRVAFELFRSLSDTDQNECAARLAELAVIRMVPPAFGQSWPESLLP